MTTTPTTDLANILHARAAEIVGQPPAEFSQGDPISSDYIPPVADSNGEIVPVSTAGGSPPVPPGGAPPVTPGTAGTPARDDSPVIHYPEVPPKVVGGLPYIREYVKLARTIMQTEMVPKAFQGRYDAITAAFMRGYELGLGPMQALDSFNVIEGKVGLSAEAMRALILQAGHLFILSEQTGSATVTCRRSDWPESIPNATYTYDMGDAELAQLLRPSRSGKPTGWQKNPRAMLAARATSGAGRAYFADVLAGMSYTPEEIRDFTDEQEVQPSPNGTASESNVPTLPTPTPPETSPPEQPSSPPADAPEAPSATAQESPSTAGSTDSASATSPADTAEPAPPTASTSTAKKARGTTKKAAAKSSAAPAAPPQEASTPPDAATGPSAGPSAPEPAPAPSSPPSDSTGSPGPGASAGQGAVLQQMRQALTEVIKGQPQAEQPLLRAFLQRHWATAAELDTDEKIQKAIDIALGWPQSAEQHPAPIRGEEVWQGFSTKVIDTGLYYVSSCWLCPWVLEEADSNANLPGFRRLELAKAAAQSHETGAYDDGTPFCAGRPAQGALGV